MQFLSHTVAKTLLAAAVLSANATLASADQSVARQWDETLLASIRKDTPRPPVHARNLFHVSAAMYDAWAAFDSTTKGLFFHEKIAANDVVAARNEAVSYAAYRVMKYRFAASPNIALITSYLDGRMAALGYSTSVTTTVGDSPAAVGNRVAATLITICVNDGSREQFNYSTPAGTPGPVNLPLIFALGGNPTLSNPNRWQPLAFSYTLDANGNPVAGGIQGRLVPFWSGVTPFALTNADRDPKRPGVYLNAPVPPQINGIGDAAYRLGYEDVIRKSSMLTPDDGVLMDIAPSAMGNNTLGTNDGNGRAVNPVTGQPYAADVVKRGDWTRCLSEFWADGPTSATPPGHWNEIANAVTDHPLFQRRMGGSGPVLDPLEYDIKMYVTLNGALHDAAITAWGLKTYHDTTRPISAIRAMCALGQCSNPKLSSYNVNGVHLEPGVVELITAATTAAGERHAALAGHEGEIAVLAWPGAPTDAANTYSGVRWVLGKNWMPYQRPTFVTPAFAGYISGHSTFSRAAAEALTELTGSEYFPGGMGAFTCNQNQFLVFEDGPSESVTLQWATYYDAADNSGISRLYGGIHPDFDDFPGRVLGSQLGAKAFAKATDLFAPVTACPADFNADHSVDGADISMLLSDWGVSGSPRDLTGDGTVSGADVAALLSGWGLCP